VGDRTLRVAAEVKSTVRAISRWPWADKIIVAVLIALAAILRLHRFDRIPYPNETADEYAYLWAGWSFLHDGVPTSWSRLAAYGSVPNYLWNGFRYPLVTPWFDHPPLFGLLVGLATSFAGAAEPLDASLSTARLVSVALGVLAVPLLYVLARRNYGRSIALVSTFLFASIPSIVIASRLALAESLIVVLLLAGLLATQKYLEGSAGGWIWLVAAGVAAGAAGLAKVPGLTVGVSVAFLLLASRRWLAVGTVVVLVALTGVVPYVLYGIIRDHSLFARVIFSQSERATGLDVLPNLLLNDVTLPVAWRDAWFPLLWIALVYVTLRPDRLIPAGIGPYLIFLVAAVPDNDLRVAYREPLFPFLCLAGGVFLCDVIAKPDLIRGAIVVFGLAFGKLAEGFDGWAMVGSLPRGYQLYPLLVAALAVPLAATAIWPSRRLTRVASALLVGGLVVAGVANMQTIAREDDLYPVLRPAMTQPLSVPTESGIALVSFRVEPDTVQPGGSVRLWTSWFGQRDVASVPLTAYLRRFDRRSNQLGPPLRLGEPATQAMKAWSTSTSVLAGVLDQNQAEGDYDLGVSVAGQPIDVGIIRVRRSTTETPAAETVSLPPTFADGVALDDVLLATSRPSTEGTVQSIGLRFRATEPQSKMVKFFAHLENGDGHVMAQYDGPPDGKYIMPVGDLIDTWSDLIIPRGTPPGRYYLSAGLYDATSGQRFATQSGADRLQLGLVVVGPPATESDLPHHLADHLANGVDLVGYDLVPAALPGHETLTLYWRSHQTLTKDYTVFVQVVDSTGQVRTQADGPPDAGRVPTSTWRSGLIVPDSHDIAVSDLPSGDYRLLVGLYLAPNGPRVPLVGSQDGAIMVTSITVK
jgi:hypothetical protein